jgi:hypothetical protein
MPDPGAPNSPLRPPAADAEPPAYSTVEPDPNTRVQEFSIDGQWVLNKLKTLIEQGNVRRIVLKNQEGRTLVELPLTVGVVGSSVATILFPFAVAIAAIGLLATRFTLVVEKNTQ